MVLTQSGEITSPGIVVTTNFFPSKWGISKLNPVKASNKEIYFSIYKSAPFLVNNLCFFILNLICKSPGITPGISSPSPV